MIYCQNFSNFRPFYLTKECVFVFFLSLLKLDKWGSEDSELVSSINCCLIFWLNLLIFLNPYCGRMCEYMMFICYSDDLLVLKHVNVGLFNWLIYKMVVILNVEFVLLFFMIVSCSNKSKTFLLSLAMNLVVVFRFVLLDSVAGSD